MNWEAFRELWPFLLAVGAHLMRTESTRSTMQSDLRNLKEAQQQDRSNISDALKEIHADNREMRSDIKELLKRVNGG